MKNENRPLNPTKKYLLAYIHLRNRKDALLDELDRAREASLRATSLMIATRLSGTSSHGGPEDAMLRASDCETVLQKHIDKISFALEERLDMIDRLTDERQKELLTYRYVNGRGWPEIMRLMNYSERQVFNVHGEALSGIQRARKECSKMQ